MDTRTQMDGDQAAVWYEGQFGRFQVDDRDRQGVRIYRAGLAGAALSVAIAAAATALVPQWSGLGALLLGLFAVFAGALGVSLWTIHIYLRPLHQLLQVFWGIGVVSVGAIAWREGTATAAAIYDHRLWLLGVGFIFAALTGIFFKEAFCFDRAETKLLVILVPGLLLGHLFGLLSASLEMGLLGAWALLFIVFAARKAVQAIPDDIGDKSVFDYLAAQRSPASGPS